jgi:hypothetical protein
MAIQKEIWVNAIIEQLNADNSFAARSVNHSAFVDNLTVHIPGAGDIEAARKNRLRAAGEKNLASERTDTDLTYNIEKYYIGPYVVPKLEEVELSYDKRNSVVKQMTGKVISALHADLITKWIPAAFTKIPTTGEGVAATAPGATGDRKAFIKSDVRSVRTQFDKWDIPLEGRCLLVDADMYGQLLDSLTSAESNAFLACADATTGNVGRLYGFDVYLRSTVLVTTAGGALKTGAAAATDCAAGFAWSEQAVSRAIGETDVFNNSDDAGEFGNVLSVAVRAGGKHLRSDGKGVCVIYQGTPA